MAYHSVYMHFENQYPKNRQSSESLNQCVPFKFIYLGQFVSDLNKPDLKI